MKFFFITLTTLIVLVSCGKKNDEVSIVKTFKDTLLGTWNLKAIRTKNNNAPTIVEPIANQKWVFRSDDSAVIYTNAPKPPSKFTIISNSKISIKDVGDFGVSVKLPNMYVWRLDASTLPGVDSVAYDLVRGSN